MDKLICIDFLSIFFQIPRIHQKLRKKSRVSDDCPSMDKQEYDWHLWCISSADPGFASKPSTNSSAFAQNTIQTSAGNDVSWRFQIILRMLPGQSIPQDAINIIIRSWQKAIGKQYIVYTRKWIQFCGDKISPFPPLMIFLCFLSLYTIRA